MEIYHLKSIGGLIECSHAIKAKSSNPTGIACYGILATNANIDLMHENMLELKNNSTKHKIGRAKFTLNDPYHKFIQNPKSIHIHVSEMFQTITQFYPPYIQIHLIHDVNVFANIDFYGNCMETDDLCKGDMKPTKPRALFQNWRQDLFQDLCQNLFQDLFLTQMVQL